MEEELRSDSGFPFFVPVFRCPGVLPDAGFLFFVFTLFRLVFPDSARSEVCYANFFAFFCGRVIGGFLQLEVVYPESLARGYA